MNASETEKNLARQLRETERQWFQLIETLVSLTVGTKDRQQALDELCEMASDPMLARRIVIAMESNGDSCIHETPELYWAAQLTLSGGKNVLMHQADRRV